ncbi:hypothetical protein [Candidatus Palauibacter sp.]|uniref:hypothetical protein n=1 Tax=Candidatus Palauibacter sp. TaxID=3101350 RepID=UPI003B51E79A
MTATPMFIQCSGMETLERAVHFAGQRVSRAFGPEPDAFGKKALGDPNLMRRIGGGRSPSLRAPDRILAFIAEQDGASGGGRDPPRRP